MKCYRKNGSDGAVHRDATARVLPSMKCYRKNGSDDHAWRDQDGVFTSPQ